MICENLKNKGLPNNIFFGRPCGKCLLCREAKREEWVLRCWLEAQQYESNMFATLTYDDMHLPPDGVSKQEMARFMHNLRECFRRKHHHVGIRFFGCGEYGRASRRPHYHILLFNCPPLGDEILFSENSGRLPIYTSKILESLWGKGFCTIGPVSKLTVREVTKYILKAYINMPFVLSAPCYSMSRRSGLGFDYLSDNLEKIIEDDGITLPGGTKYPLPHSLNLQIIKHVGIERYKTELAEPRAERAKMYYAAQMAKTGLSMAELYEQRIERAKTKLNH